MTVRFKTIKQFSAESGYSEAAIRSKIQDGTWLKGSVWRRAPDKRILIDVYGFEDWVERGYTSEKLDKSKSPPPLEK